MRVAWTFANLWGLHLPLSHWNSVAVQFGYEQPSSSEPSPQSSSWSHFHAAMMQRPGTLHWNWSPANKVDAVASRYRSALSRCPWLNTCVKLPFRVVLGGKRQGPDVWKLRDSVAMATMLRGSRSPRDWFPELASAGFNTKWDGAKTNRLTELLTFSFKLAGRKEQNIVRTKNKNFKYSQVTFMLLVDKSLETSYWARADGFSD